MTPLEALEIVKNQNVHLSLGLFEGMRYMKAIETIETALKRLENYEGVWQNTNLKQIFISIEDWNIERKKLKALEIIKEKNVFVWGFIHRKEEIKDFEYTYYYYKNCYGYFHSGYDYKLLTEEEFNLLKEVLL